MTTSDEFLPAYHFSERHSITIDAERYTISEAMNSFDFSESRVIRFLFFLRGLPKNMINGLEGVKKMGFNVLSFKDQHEIVLGLVGQFWKLNGEIQNVPPHEFKDFSDPAFAKTIWSFSIVGERAPFILETETRIACPDSATRKKFARYWFFIRPFSGWIRIEMLKAIRTRCLKS